MESFKRLMMKGATKACRLLIRFDPDEVGEEWAVKFYPEPDDDAHFYAYNSSLEAASRQLLEELESSKW
jgi:hypothetical protein